MSDETTSDESTNIDVVSTLTSAVRGRKPVALLTVLDGERCGASLLVNADGSTQGSLGNDELDRVATRDALGELDAGRNVVRSYGPRGETTPADLVGEAVVRVFIESFAPPPRMIIFGAVDFTAALARVAKVLGYHVTVCDARKVFATPKRFPMADELVVAWPNELFDRIGGDLGSRDAVCVLTHDPKFDVPAIRGALAGSVGYIGVMGSRRTHDKRLERLREVGIGDADIARLHSPIGLDIGARTPEETAISICAEIVAARSGRSARPLSATSGPIH